MKYRVWVFGWSSRQHPGGRSSTHASRQHILRFREGYARKCDYDYRPRLGLNMGEEGGVDEQENVQHEQEENRPCPQQKEEVGKRKGSGEDMAKVRNITSDIQK